MCKTKVCYSGKRFSYCSSSVWRSKWNMILSVFYCTINHFEALTATLFKEYWSTAAGLDGCAEQLALNVSPGSYDFLSVTRFGTPFGRTEINKNERRKNSIKCNAFSFPHRHFPFLCLLFLQDKEYPWAYLRRASVRMHTLWGNWAHLLSLRNWNCRTNWSRRSWLPLGVRSNGPPIIKSKRIRGICYITRMLATLISQSRANSFQKAFPSILQASVKDLCGDTCSALISPGRLVQNFVSRRIVKRKKEKYALLSYVHVDRSEWENLGAGMFLRCVPVEFVSATVPLDGVEGWVFQVECAGQGCLVASTYDAGFDSEFDVF